METWRELQGMQYVAAVLLVTLVPLLLSILCRGGFNLLGKKRVANLCGIPIAIALILTLCYSIVAIDFAIPKNSYLYQQYYAASGSKLAVVEKSSERIVAYNLRQATLRPWPLPTVYRVVEYPVRLVFFSNLQPITKNPKVVPLTVQVTVSIPKDANPQFLADYILHQERQSLDENIFKRYAFDLLQHKLSQEIAGQLNPFDEASMAAFKEFVTKELNPYLVQHKVTDVTVALK